MSASEGKATRQAGFKCSTDAIGAYLFVMLDRKQSSASETVIARATAGAQVLGVTYESTAAANRNVGVNLEGVCYLKVDGNTVAIKAGDRLKSDANGKGVPLEMLSPEAVKAFPMPRPGQEYGVIALCSSMADDDVIPVLIQKGIV